VQDVMNVLPQELAAPHEPRPIRFLRRERAGAWRLKLYGIALPGHEVRGELAVVDFESRAWLRHVPDNQDGPDLDRYLDDHFDADL
jgi:hypothetical protein